MLELDTNRRILVVDDNPAIHADFSKVLCQRKDRSELARIEREVFGSTADLHACEPVFELDAAHGGEPAVEKMRRACAEGTPFAVAFVDIRMPPGWDGIETIERLWAVDGRLQVVICSAYSDYSWLDIRRRLGASDALLILKKPFDNAEVSQLAYALTRKWSLHEAEQRRQGELVAHLKARRTELEEAQQQLVKETAERRKMEAELRLAQKLEAIGQLAAGIAHEINTPAQYVSDNVHFLYNCFADLEALRKKLVEGCARMGGGEPFEAVRAEISQFEEDVDLEYIRERAPRAFESALDGLERIAKIVRAMKEFGHHDNGEKSTVDLNRALLTTLEVARNEYKYVADVETELGELPPVVCLAGELNQVFLNLLVNAAHAIGDVVGESGARGTIRVKSALDGGDVVVVVEDSGSGIPPEVQARIFDPFFTTKEVGRGTGQGLAIAHTIVVDKHGGSLSFETEPGRGTTFSVRIPVDGGRGERAGGA